MRTLRQLSIGGLLAAGLALPCLAGSLPDSPTTVRPLLIGAAVPSVTLSTPGGETRTLDQVLERKPAVVVFYRGGW